MTSEQSQDKGFAWAVLCGHLFTTSYLTCLSWTLSYIAARQWLHDFHVTEAHIGYIFTVCGLCATLSSMTAGFFVKRFGLVNTMVISITMMLAGGLVSSFTTKSFLLLYIPQSLMWFGSGLVQVVTVMAMNQWFHKRRSTTNSLSGIARPFGGVVSSYIYRWMHHQGYEWWLMLQLTCAAGLLLYPCALLQREFNAGALQPPKWSSRHPKKRVKRIRRITDALEAPAYSVDVEVIASSVSTSENGHDSDGLDTPVPSTIMEKTIDSDSAISGSDCLGDSHHQALASEKLSLVSRTGNDSLLQVRRDVSMGSLKPAIIKSTAVGSKSSTPLKYLLKNHKFWFAVMAQAFVAASIRIINRFMPLLFDEEKARNGTVVGHVHRDFYDLTLIETYQYTLLASKVFLGFGCSFCKSKNQEVIYLISSSVTLAAFVMVTLTHDVHALARLALVVLGMGSGSSGGSWITLLVNNIGKENITTAISVYLPFINVFSSVNQALFGWIVSILSKEDQLDAVLLPSIYLVLAVSCVIYLICSRKSQTKLQTNSVLASMAEVRTEPAHAANENKESPLSRSVSVICENVEIETVEMVVSEVDVELAMTSSAQSPRAE